MAAAGPRQTGSTAAVVKSGKLDKLTTNRTWMGYRKFKPRWVVLREDNLGYYDTPTAGDTLKGCIPVALIQYAAANPEMEKWGFTVYAGDEPEMQYEFSATSEKERDEWIDAIMTLLHVEEKDRRRTTTTGQASHYFGDRKSIYDFRVGQKVGEGGTASVFVVTTEGEDGPEQYAMKVVDKKKLDERALAAAAAEQGIMSAIKKIDHPYILNLHWAFEHRDKLHLVLDFCVNDLYTVLGAAKRFSHAKAQLYAAELASALNELHSMGFIHCDLKLENILVDEEQHTMLADFGFTKRVLEIGDEDDDIPQGHTLCYTPPEVLKGDRVEPTTDWWGLGCLIYEYHHGLPPYYHDSVRKTMKAINSGVIPPSPYIEAGSPTWDIIEKCLVQDKEDRVGGAKGPSFADLQAHLFLFHL